MVKEIIIKSGDIILVDDDEFKWLSKGNWSLNQHGYVIGNVKLPNGKRVSGSLHRILMNPPKGMEIDHKNNIKLDNRKDNLRICTKQENMRNRKIQSKYAKKKTSSKYKGVTWKKATLSWCVQISYDNENKHVGLFSNEDAAANAYNYYAKKFYKEFAKLNDVSFMPKEKWKEFKIKEETSQYRGVSYQEYNTKWVAQIWNGKTNIKIGEFNDELDAARAYNDFALKIKGDKARLNQIEG